MSLRTLFVSSVLALLAIDTGSAQQSARPWPPQGLLPINQASPVLSPADSMATFVLPPGYRVELVASEPMVIDPVAMDWDLEGRLWVVEMPGYMPDMAATGELNPVGRIVVLEDSDEDGRMDKRTVFMDGLVLVRSIKVLEHGVLLGEPPDLWLAKDTNGDLKADSKERVTNVYGRRDANVEHNANSLFWALDNWMYTSEVDMDLRLTASGFEIRRTLARGQWGVTQDDAGRIFRNTNENVLHVDFVPAKYFVRHPALLRTRGLYDSLSGDNREANRVWPARPTPGVNRGYQTGVLKADNSLANFTSVASPTIYRGDRLPADARGNLFVVEPAGNLVARLVLEDDGTTLRARKAYERGEILASTDERFRPVALSAAPDGTLYIADMYRGIIQHKGYITEYLRDQINARHLSAPIGFGRIYRLVHETTTRGPRPRLTGVASADLVPYLSHPNGWWRDTAQRLIVERRDKSVAPALAPLAASAPDWRTKLHALWTLDGIDAITTTQVTRALGDQAPEVRLSAVRLAERFIAASAGVRTALLARVDDPHWAVRRQLAATLGELNSTLKMAPLATMLEKYGDDPIVVDAAISGLRGEETTMLTRLLTSTEPDTYARAAALTMLSATVLRGADNARVQTVFDWVAEATRPEWQRAALLRGAEVALLNQPMPAAPPRAVAAAPPATPGTAAPCPTCPGARGGPGGAPAFPNAPAAPPAGAGATRPRGPALRVGSEPAIAKLPATDALGKRAAALLATIEWPGKPGATAPLTPLAAAELARFNEGRDVYAAMCTACHQPDGRGRLGLAASLIGSDLALGPIEVTARILLNGKEGSTGLMPPLGAAMPDDKLAAVLTYIRREWGQDGSPVDAVDVARARESSKDRTKPWTAEELTALTRTVMEGRR